MAKKPRTPDPPRRVQAPKQRHAPRQGLTPDRLRMLLYGAGGAAAIGLVVALIVVFAGGKSAAGNPESIATTMKAAGCTLTTRPATKSGLHITSFNQTVTYPTYPPVSGRHYYQPPIWGNYTQPVDPRQAVHAEEHGGVVIWIGPDVQEPERQQISDFYDESPNAMLVTPIENTSKGVKYPKHAPPDAKIYLTAWTTKIEDGTPTDGQDVIATCPHFDEKAFAAFRDELRGRGPERFPVSILTPGT
ncbi:MAG TPA: DUF3105 domain-containing protein [Gaiellaceae bacterium]|nr:DUF3105 domain-containing protein [Gaiellaceae bacterium]